MHNANTHIYFLLYRTRSRQTEGPRLPLPPDLSTSFECKESDSVNISKSVGGKYQYLDQETRK